MRYMETFYFHFNSETPVETGVQKKFLLRTESPHLAFCNLSFPT